MSVSVADCLAAITHHTRGLAEAAEGNLDARIEHCPEWSMSDLVWHLIEVHRFWTTVVVELPTDQPEVGTGPSRPADDQLIAMLLSGAETLVASLEAADQRAHCWTWGLEENVWFVTRHQVQEAAVHHWDAVNAVGSASWAMDDLLAIDSVEEFLTHSVANARWPAPAAEPLGGTLWFCPCIADSAVCPSWRITDGAIPGTLRLDVHPGTPPDIRGPQDGDHVEPQSLLLWLYRRLPDSAIDHVGPDRGERPLLQRFRAFTSTD